LNFVLLGIAVSLISLSCFLWYSRRVSPLRLPGVDQEPAREERLTDYQKYRLSYQERILYTGGAAIFLFSVAYVFYHSLFLSLGLTPLAYFYPAFKTKKLSQKRRRELNLQFKDALYSLASSLMAGKSVELAFKDVYQDLRLLYPDPQTPIILEIQIILHRLEMNESLEDALADLARRAHSEDIESFADVFIIAKRSGGNMVEIIRNTSAIIADKLQIKEEIETLLAHRQIEKRVLAVMPVALIMLLSWATGDYMLPVFTTWTGRLAMTAAILILTAANILAQKITTIEV